MTLARRVARLETGRTTTEIVLAWLAEAHVYPTLPEYLTSLLDAPDAAWPLHRIASEVEAAVRARARGPEDEVWQAVRRSVGDAYFLFELILRLNLDARSVCDYEGLRWALLTQWRAALSLHEELKRRSKRGEPDDDHVILGIDDWRTTVGLSLTALYAEEAARTSIEQKFFTGQVVLFPSLAHERVDLVARLELLARLVDDAPRLQADEAPSVRLDELRSKARAGAEARMSDVVTVARAEALGMIGEHDRVLALLERRQRLLASPVPTTYIRNARGAGA